MRSPKKTHAEVGYQATSKHGGQHCSVCSMFRRGKPPSCTAVKQPIFPNGWCRLFEAKAHADGGRVTDWSQQSYDPFDVATSRVRKSVVRDRQYASGGQVFSDDDVGL